MEKVKKITKFLFDKAYLSPGVGIFLSLVVEAPFRSEYVLVGGSFAYMTVVILLYKLSWREEADNKWVMIDLLACLIGLGYIFWSFWREYLQ